MPINISNVKGRDAVVALEGLHPERDVRYTDPKHGLVTTRRLLKSDIEHDLKALLEEYTDLDALADVLAESDPEVDVERFGAFLGPIARVYVTDEGIIHAVDEFEIVTNPDGTLRERRERRKETPNINSDVPIRWSGKFIKKSDAIKRFVFINKQQVVHVNGLTFDFLYDIAKELHDRDSLLLVRGGEKANEPIIMSRGGKPYNAFLEGRIDGDSYCLILHFSNMELKKPKVIEEVEEKGSGGEEEKGKAVEDKRSRGVEKKRSGEVEEKGGRGDAEKKKSKPGAVATGSKSGEKEARKESKKVAEKKKKK
jgi:hypothetical protein